MDSVPWMQDPELSDIPKEKLEFLQKMVFESGQLSDKERLPFFMALATRAKTEKISFSQNEISRIVEVIKKYSTPQEIRKLDQIINIFKDRN